MFRQIIEREHPDQVVFLGDNVQADRSEDLMKLHKRFVQEIKRLHPLDKTVYIIGDNDYARQSEIKHYISRQGFMNKDPFLPFRISTNIIGFWKLHRRI